MQCHQRIRCQKPRLTANDLCCKQPTAGLPTFVVWTYWGSLWFTACTAGKVPKRSHDAKSCTLITNRTDNSPYGEVSTSSASKKIPPYYGNPKFINVFTPARQSSLSCAILIQFTPSHHNFFHPNSFPYDGRAPVEKKGKQSPYNRPWNEVYLYSFFNLIAKWGGWSTPRPGTLNPRNRPGTHCTWGWLDAKAGLDWSGNSCPHQFSIPGPSSP